MKKTCCVVDAQGKRVGCYQTAREAEVLRAVLGKDSALTTQCHVSSGSLGRVKRTRKRKR